MRSRRDVLGSGVPGWEPARLRALVVVAALVALAVLAGVVLAVVGVLTEEEPGSADAARQEEAPSPETSSQDALAAMAMPTTDPDDALPGPVSTQAAGVIELPRTTAGGPADVPTGFPRTPEGAGARRAPMEGRAMRGGWRAGVGGVIAGGAARGAPTPETWSGAAGMASLLSAAG